LLIRNLRYGINNELSRFIQNSKQASIIRKEYQNIINNKQKQYQYQYINNIFINKTIRNWIIEIIGPLNSPYSNGIFNIELI